MQNILRELKLFFSFFLNSLFLQKIEHLVILKGLIQHKPQFDELRFVNFYNIKYIIITCKTNSGLKKLFFLKKKKVAKQDLKCVIFWNHYITNVFISICDESIYKVLLKKLYLYVYYICIFREQF